MNWSESLFASPFTQSVGWTILHSLWQGALLALVLALLLIVMKKNSASMRYFVASATLFVLFALAVLTFFSLLKRTSTEAGISPEEIFITINVDEEKETSFWAGIQSNVNAGLSTIQEYFNRHLPLIVLTWLCGVVILLLRFLGGIAYLQRLKHYRTQAVPAFWQATLNELASKIKVQRAVKLIESAMVQVPTVIGFLKPVILLPIGTLSGLSQRQVECILAHELAHIRRNDFILHLVQSVIEILFFYNPFVWWIKNVIDDERENCCDDIALFTTGDELTLAKSLAYFEEMRLSNHHNLAMAFPGQKGGLLYRIRRILKGHQTNATFSEGFMAGFLLLMFLGMTTLYAKNDPMFPLKKVSGMVGELAERIEEGFNNMVAATPKPEKKPRLHINLDTPMEGAEEPLQFAETGPRPLPDTIRIGKNLMIVTDSWGNVEIFKDGVKIPKEDYSKYKELFEVIPGKKSRYAYRDPDLDFDFDFDIDMPAIPEINVNIPEIAIPPIRFRTGVRGEPGFFTWNEGKDEYKIHYDEDGNIERLIVNGKTIKEKDYPKYEKVLKKWKAGNRSGLNFNFSFAPELDDLLREELREANEDVQRELERVNREIRREQWRMNDEMKRQEERGERENIRIRIHDEKMRDHNRKTEMLLDELRKDGLVGKEENKISIKARQNKIIVNGKELEGVLFEKYKDFFRANFDFDVSEEDSNWNWNWNWND